MKAVTDPEAQFGRELYVDVVELAGEFGALRWSANYKILHFEKANPNTVNAAKNIAAGFEHDFGDIPTTWVDPPLSFSSAGSQEV
jgi:hypothetical protein